MGFTLAMLLPLVGPALEAAAQGLEKVFNKPKQGDVKFEIAKKLAEAIIDAKLKSGEINGKVDDGVVGPLVETVVQIMKGRGELGGEVVAQPKGMQVLTIPAGAKVTIEL